MRRVTQKVFEPLPDPGPDPLAVHRHSDSDQMLVVFIHGLNGSRYGTWRKLAELLFADLPHVSLGFFDYPSGFRRIRLRASVRLEEHADVLADNIRDGGYRRVILVGHSMGGLLAKATIKRLLDTGMRDEEGMPALDRVAGLVFFGTPQAGSTAVPKISQLISKDAKVLRAHSKLVTEVCQRFTDRVDMNRLQLHNDRAWIRTYAVRGIYDTWVDKFSALLNLPAEQTKTVGAGHSDLVPYSAEHDAYEWLVHRIVECSRPDRDGVQPAAVSEARSVNLQTRRPDDDPASMLLGAASRATMPVILMVNITVNLPPFYRDNPDE